MSQLEAGVVPHGLGRSWYRGVTRESWRALVAANLGWLFDGYENIALILVLPMALGQLLPPPLRAVLPRYQGLILALHLIGWATGGTLWGIVTDYFGRKRAMIYAIVAYSLFSGLSALATSWQAFAALRFLVGLGMGAEWGTGATLVAEKFPLPARAKAGGLMQAGFGIGFFIASLLWLPMQHVGPSAWRIMFLLGALPALVLAYVRRRVEEPEQWAEVDRRRRELQARRRQGAVLDEDELALARFTLAEVFGPYLGRTAPAFLLALLTNIGIYAVSSFAFVYAGQAGRALGADPAAVAAVAAIAYNLGSLAGLAGLPFVADAWGRRWTAALVYVLAFVFTLVYFQLRLPVPLLLLAAAMNGIFTGGQYSIFAVWLPELYPTRVRATGVTAVFNLGRYLAALGPLYAGILIVQLHGIPRMSVVLSLSYLLAAALVPLVPETRGRPLPE